MVVADAKPWGEVGRAVAQRRAWLVANPWADGRGGATPGVGGRASALTPCVSVPRPCGDEAGAHSYRQLCSVMASDRTLTPT